MSYSLKFRSLVLLMWVSEYIYFGISEGKDAEIQKIKKMAFKNVKNIKKGFIIKKSHNWGLIQI